MSEFRVQPNKLHTEAEQLWDVRRELLLDGAELETIRSALKESASCKAMEQCLSRLQKLRRKAVQQSAAVNRLSNTLEQAAALYEKAETENITRAEENKAGLILSATRYRPWNLGEQDRETRERFLENTVRYVPFKKTINYIMVGPGGQAPEYRMLNSSIVNQFQIK